MARPTRDSVGMLLCLNDAVNALVNRSAPNQPSGTAIDSVWVCVYIIVARTRERALRGACLRYITCRFSHARKPDIAVYGKG